MELHFVGYVDGIEQLRDHPRADRDLVFSEREHLALLDGHVVRQREPDGGLLSRHDHLGRLVQEVQPEGHPPCVDVDHLHVFVHDGFGTAALPLGQEVDLAVEVVGGSENPRFGNQHPLFQLSNFDTLEIESDVFSSLKIEKSREIEKNVKIVLTLATATLVLKIWMPVTLDFRLAP